MMLACPCSSRSSCHPVIPFILFMLSTQPVSPQTFTGYGP